MEITDKKLSDLQKKLLEAEKQQDFISAKMAVISEFIPNKMCSLWKINHVCDSVSIYCREKYNPPIEKNYEYVHKLIGSLIHKSLLSISNKIYNKIDVTEKENSACHQGHKRISEMELKEFISIPIPYFHDEYYSNSDINKYTAVFNIYPKNGFEFNDHLAQLIRDQFSLSFHRFILLQKEAIAEKIIEIYEEKHTDLNGLLDKIIRTTFQEFFKYEACSIFLWDPNVNYFILQRTTGIKGNPKKNTVIYSYGESMTGYLAEKKESKIIKDLSQLNEDPDLNLAHYQNKHRFEENTFHKKMSYMLIPIKSPGDSDELIGLIRFANKLNHKENKIVDYFNNDDKELIEHAAKLIALYMEVEQNKKIQIARSRQLAHDFLAPISAIQANSFTLLDKYDNKKEVFEIRVKAYLEEILNHSQHLIALTKTAKYGLWNEGGRAKSHTYKVVKRNLLEDILSPAKRMVNPLLNDIGIKAENIKITGKKYLNLFIDHFAFRQVFYNLFANSIKYRKDDSSFKIEVSCSGLKDVELEDGIKEKGYLVQIKDWGIGIRKDEKENIFFYGYRSHDVDHLSIRGSGIGLTVVRNFLDDFYCKIWLSNLQNPTCFYIFIPEILNNDSYLKSKDWTDK